MKTVAKAESASDAFLESREGEREMAVAGAEEIKPNCPVSHWLRQIT